METKRETAGVVIDLSLLVLGFVVQVASRGSQVAKQGDRLLWSCICVPLVFEGMGAVAAGESRPYRRHKGVRSGPREVVRRWQRRIKGVEKIVPSRSEAMRLESIRVELRRGGAKGGSTAELGRRLETVTGCESSKERRRSTNESNGFGLACLCLVSRQHNAQHVLVRPMYWGRTVSENVRLVVTDDS